MSITYKHALSARRALAKSMHSKYTTKKNNKSIMAGAWIDEDGKQCLTDNGYWAIRWNDPVEDIATASITPPYTDFHNLKKAINDWDTPVSLDLTIDLKLLDEYRKRVKKTENFEDKLIRVQIGKGAYQAKYITDILNTFTGTPVFYQGKKHTSAFGDIYVLHIIAENGEALVMPITMPDGEKFTEGTTLLI